MNYEKANSKIHDFRDLNAWQYGHKLVLSVYRLTDKFPKKELFSLSDQMRRAVVSITSNIAEGFSRNTANDKRHFYSMALGSVTEIQNQLIVARDIEYLNLQDFDVSYELSVVTHKLINGLIRGVISHDS